MEKLSKEQQFIIFGLILVIFTGLGVMAYRRLMPEKETQIQDEASLLEESIETKKIMVHVAGAVFKEGVYQVKRGYRVIDVIKLAGGELPTADLSILNLAEEVKDGVKILVPAKAAIIERLSENQKNRSSEGTLTNAKVSLNSATEEELRKIPGVGPSTAKRIIEHRSSNGPFSKIEDIMKVKGIGKGKFEKMRENITI